MKKYIIENQLVYNAEDRLLSRIGDERADIVLTHIAGRLLALLLESRGEVVLRDVILQQVWDDYGLVSSNNNLNHYISNLRKQFSTLALEKSFIITEPKRGFRINADVTVEEQVIETSAAPSTLVQVSESSDNEANRSASIKSTKEKRHPLKLSVKVIVTLILCLVVTVIGLGYWLIIGHRAAHPEIRGIQYVLSLRNCPIYTTERNFSLGHIQNVRIILKQILIKDNVTCVSDDIVISYFSGVFDNGEYNGQAFISKCKLKGDTVFSCTNRYIYSVKKNED